MNYFKENIFKNVATVVCVLISIPFIENSINIIENKSIEALMGLFGLLLVYSGAVNFTFSYDSIDFKDNFYRYLAHVTTFIAQLVMSMLLLAVYFLITEVYPDLSQFTLLISILSIISMIMFDILDFYKNKSMHSK
ncbi:MAG: hypothetical protein NUV65_02730 [Candidatus Roizmanbacteria bacterium]|nr:hypothetical protein [Candidatus Roizmanbacteria bacterium]